MSLLQSVHARVLSGLMPKMPEYIKKTCMQLRGSIARPSIRLADFEWGRKKCVLVRARARQLEGYSMVVPSKF